MVNAPQSMTAAMERSELNGASLAAKLGVTRQAVQMWMSGDRQPSGPARRLLAIELDVPLDVVDSWFAVPSPAAESDLAPVAAVGG